MIEGLLRMSMMGAVTIAAVLFIRLCLRRMPKIFSYALWAIVLFRLLCPVSVAMPVSVFNLLSVRDAQQETDVSGQLPLRSDLGNGQAVLSEHEGQNASGESEGPDQNGKAADGAGTFLQGRGENDSVSEIPAAKADDGWKRVCTAVWLAGVAAMLGYAGYDLVRLKKLVKGASLDRDNIYLLGGITSPFVACMIRPRIYLPYGLSEHERQYVLLHEQTHIKRGDPLFRALAYVALIVHWFNPLVWVAFFVSARDMEMSCDELVLRRLGAQIKCEYSNSLLVMAQGSRLVTNISLAFGEGDTGRRIKNVLNYKKATVQVLAVGALVVAIALVALGTNPVERAAANDVSEPDGENETEPVRAEGEDVSQAEKLTPELLCQMADRGELESCDFRAFRNGIQEAPEKDSFSSFVRFTFTTDPGNLVVEVSYVSEEGTGEEPGTPDMLRLIRQWDNETLVIYSRDASYYLAGIAPTGAEIEAFLAADFDIMREISFDLPESLTLEPYNSLVGYAGGRLFSPDVYEGSSFVPLTWKASGAVTRFMQEGMLTWEDGKIAEISPSVPGNHGVAESAEQIGGLDAPALLRSENFELYTGPEMYEMDEQGISYDEVRSYYWCLYIAREGETYGYLIYLNQKNYTAADMMALAKTVRLTDPAGVQEGGPANEEDSDEPLAVLETISVRTISRSARCIDLYVAPDDEWERRYGEELMFAEDCKFSVNEVRDAMSPHEVSFTKFAAAIEEGDASINKPCIVEMGADGLVHAITLVSSYYLSGVSYVPLPDWVCGDDPAFTYPEYDKEYPIVRTETIDFSGAAGEVTAEIRKGYRKEDGTESYNVDFRDENGHLLYAAGASNEGMCLHNVYAGRMDGAGDPFILEVSLENRDTSGVYSYQVFALDGESGPQQIAGSSIEWQKDGPLVYDAMEMDIFMHMLGHYLDDSHLLAGLEWTDGGDLGIRTDPACDEDLFTYKNCKPACFPDPYDGADVR